MAQSLNNYIIRASIFLVAVFVIVVLLYPVLQNAFLSNIFINIIILLALIIGATGSILVLEPWKSNFQLLQILPVMAGFFYACNIILIRKFCRNESPISLTFAVGVMFFVSGFLGIILLEFIFDEFIFLNNMPFVTVGWPDLTIFVFVFIIFLFPLSIKIPIT